jgi:hypothetical protein
MKCYIWLSPALLPLAEPVECIKPDTCFSLVALDIVISEITS